MRIIRYVNSRIQLNLLAFVENSGYVTVCATALYSMFVSLFMSCLCHCLRYVCVTVYAIFVSLFTICLCHEMYLEVIE